MLSEDQKEILKENISFSILNYNLPNVVKILQKYPSLIQESNYSIKDLNDQYILPKSGLTLLHLSAYADYLEAFIYFCDLNLPISAPSLYSYLPIHYALSRKSLEISNYILAKEPSLVSNSEKANKDVSHSLLYYAIESNDIDIVKFLFENGYSIEDSSNAKDLSNVLKNVIIKRPSLFSFIINKIRTCNIPVTQQKEELPFLMLSIISDNSELVQSLIESGIDQSLASSSFGSISSFYYACSKKLKKVAKYLLENMKTVEDNAAYLYSICYSLCKLCSPSLVKFVLFSEDFDVVCDSKNIINRGINILKLNSTNKEPPLFALLDDKNLSDNNLPKVFEIIKLFIQKGYPIDFQPEGKNTLLGEACLGLFADNKKPIKLIAFLLENGANPFAIAGIKKMPLFDYLKLLESTRERHDEIHQIVSVFQPYVDKYSCNDVKE